MVLGGHHHENFDRVCSFESQSFCHALLEQFTKGLEDADHSNEVLDLYAMRFDPVLTSRDWPDWIDEAYRWIYSNGRT